MKKPIAVVLRVSDQAARANDLGGIAAIVEAVTERLTEEGLPHQLYLEDDAAPPPPRVDINVVLWNPGDEELWRQAVGVGLLVPVGSLIMTVKSAGTIVVDCQGFAEGATAPTYRARFQRSLASVDVDAQQTVGRQSELASARSSSTVWPRSARLGTDVRLRGLPFRD